MSFNDTRKWNAFWIGTNQIMIDWRAPVLPAPCFRKEFMLEQSENVRLYVCGLGYHEVWINGKRVSDGELMPTPTNFDRHAGYLVFDISAYLKAGKNTIGVILGNGLFNCHTPEVWHFDKATWRNYPQLILELTSGEKTILASDNTWKYTYDGPITFDGLRNGEVYDARKEMPGWAENGFDDTAWQNAVVAPGPGGSLFEQTSPLCRVKGLFPMKEIAPGLYDCGQNIAGRAELAVQGEAGAEIILKYSDVLDENGALDQKHISIMVQQGEFQTEHYTLKGEGVEVWHSRFTYHGFRYVSVEISGKAEVFSLTAQLIYSDFAEVGDFSCSDEIINKLEACTKWSYKNNMVGIPTDCPHREKNGWINDHQLATATGLFNYDSKELYREWLGTVRDCQRPNGHIPGMAPTSGWGYNWGSGALFGAALMGIPREVYIFRGDDTLMRENYEAARKDLEFCESMAQGNIVRFGLGDWKHARGDDKAVDPAFITTGWYYRNLKIFGDAAKLFGREDDAKWSCEKAAEVRDSFLKEYSNGNGSFAKDEKSALASAIGFGLCPENEIRQTVEKLNTAMLSDGCRADFGIVGAKFVPRVLAEHGYADTALQIFRQENYPGWAKWVLDGETTLIEDFPGKESHNHIMYGDISAWFMQYAAGIEPSFDRPGFKEVVLKPCFVSAFDHVNAWYDTIYGRINIRWERTADGIAFTAGIPAGIPGKLILPDGRLIPFENTVDQVFSTTR